MRRVWWNGTALALALGASTPACGQSIRHERRDSVSSETPLPNAGATFAANGGSGGATSAAGGADSAGGSSAVGNLGGTTGTMSDAGAPSHPSGGLGVPAVLVDEIPQCDVGEPVAIAEEARGDAAIALDRDNVYFVGLRGVSSVSKDGADARVLGPADETEQVAVDADNVYFGGRSFWMVPKAGGDATLLLDGQVAGVVGTDDGVYFTNWAITPTSLQRWSSSGGFELLDRFDEELWVPQLAADDAYVYVTPGATKPSHELTRVRRSDGAVEALTTADTVRGFAVAGDRLYLSEELTRTVKVVHLEERETVTLVSVDGFPTGLAADDDHVYLNVQVILAGDSRYHGHLVRFGPNGEHPCAISTSIEYGVSVAVDDTALYWIGERKLWKLPK